ncbi:MAG: peptide deformylase [Myxococcota bacterium]|nr:peptide deformylase [Myxococcota bacterium]
MAIMDVLPYPNPFLRRRANPVESFDENLKTIVADMEETMADRDGIGLAATQVGLNLRLLLLSPYAFEGEAGLGKPTVVVINPEVVEKSAETEIAEEGCLSFPQIFIPVERPKWVRIRAYDADGKPFEISGEGLGARAILHEIDHLNGVVMVDHVSHLQRRRALKKHQKNQAIKSRESQ